MKKDILFIYPSMIIGGSTTALISLLNSLNSEKYNIDLQLYRNEGPLLDSIPNFVNILPEVSKYNGRMGRFIKLAIFLLSGNILKAIWKGFTEEKKTLFSRAALADFQAKFLSKKNKKKYDYAIGFLEGWSDRYLAFCINSCNKYAWLHSTFANITSSPKHELNWMKKVDKIVFVADSCKMAFIDAMPEMTNKVITVENITDSNIIRRRSFMIDNTDEVYNSFIESKKFKIITVCRITIEVKGLDRIVSCAKQLKLEGFEFLWYIVGDGDDMEEFLTLIENADIKDCVVPIGRRMNPYPFIAASDILCMPSRYEGKPITVTESMILGVPPIVTEYLSAYDQIRNGQSGVVVGNNDNDIKLAIKECIQNRQSIEHMKAYLKSTEYGNCEYAKEIEKLLLN